MFVFVFMLMLVCSLIITYLYYCWGWYVHSLLVAHRPVSWVHVNCIVLLTHMSALHQQNTCWVVIVQTLSNSALSLFRPFRDTNTSPWNLSDGILCISDDFGCRLNAENVRSLMQFASFQIRSQVVQMVSDRIWRVKLQEALSSSYVFKEFQMTPSLAFIILKS